MDLEKEAESIGGEVKGRTNTKDGRSFKEVLEGIPQNSKSEGGMAKNTRDMAAFDADEYSRRHEEVNSKGMESIWSEESVNSSNLEQIK